MTTLEALVSRLVFSNQGDKITNIPIREAE